MANLILRIGAEEMTARRRLRHAVTMILILGVALGVASCGKSPGASPNSMVSAILDRVGAAGSFVDASTAGRSAIRHVPSGLVCTLAPNGAFDLEAFPSDSGNPGATCAHATNDVATTFVAVHFGPEANLDTVFGESIAFSSGHEPAQTWSGAPSSADLASPEGLPHFRIARLKVNIAEEQRYLRVAVTEARGWYVQQIVSAPLGQAEKAEGDAGVEWRQVLKDFVKIS